MAIDVAVTSPFTRKAVRSSSPCEDYAAQQKHAKYDASFRGKNYLFAAVVFANEEGNSLGSLRRGWVASLARFVVERSVLVQPPEVGVSGYPQPSGRVSGSRGR